MRECENLSLMTFPTHNRPVILSAAKDLLSEALLGPSSETLRCAQGDNKAAFPNFHNPRVYTSDT